MATYKKNIVVDLKKNFIEKTHLIEKLKELINSNISNFEKIKTFKKLREKWVKIGKVQKRKLIQILHLRKMFQQLK